MSLESVPYQMHVYNNVGEVGVIGFQPPLPDVHLAALDDILVPDGSIGENAWVEKKRPDVGGAYTELSWELQGEANAEPSPSLEVVAAEVASILRDKGVKLEVSSEVQEFPQSGFLFGGRHFTHEEYMLQEFGVSPAVARLWLQSAFSMTPEEVRAANPLRHGNHDVEAFVRIALGDQSRYMLHDVYMELHSEIEEAENMSSGGRGINRELLSWSRDSFRDQSRDLMKRFGPVAELAALGVNEDEFDAIELAREAVKHAREAMYELSPQEKALGITATRELLIVEELVGHSYFRPEDYQGVSFVVRHAGIAELALGQPLSEERLTRESVHQTFMGEPVTLNTTLGDIVVPMYGREATTVLGEPIVELTKDSHLAIKS